MRSVLTHREWTEEGRRRFGANMDAWRFVCPSCGHVASIADWRAAGASEGAIAFSCVGRWVGGREAFGDQTAGPGPCNYAGGGLFAINPVRVQIDGGHHDVFSFAEASSELVKETAL